MREFRIWDTRNKEYVEEPDYKWMLSRDGNLHNTETDTWYKPNDERYIVEFYTRLKDKNGVKIFEGDLLKVNEMILKCRWNLTGFVFIYNDFMLTAGFGWVENDCEVIGNIYESSRTIE